MKYLLLFLILTLSFSSAFALVEDAYTCQYEGHFRGLLDFKEQPELNYFIATKDCNNKEFIKSPCRCYNDDSKANKRHTLKEIKKFRKGEGKEEFVKATSKMKAAYRQKIADKYKASMNQVFQQLMYFDSLRKFGLLSDKLLYQVKDCSFGGITRKLKKLTNKCGGEKIQKGMRDLFYTDVSAEKPFEDFFIKQDKNLSEVIDNKIHRKNSCLPYKTYMEMNVIDSLTNGKLMDASVGMIRQENETKFYGENGEILQGKFDEEMKRRSEMGESFIPMARYHEVDGREIGFNLRTTRGFYGAYGLMNSAKHAKNPIIAELATNPDLFKSLHAAWRKETMTIADGKTKPVSFLEYTLQQEHAMEKIFQKINNKCEQLFDGKALVSILCNENPKIPFEEYANNPSFRKLASSSPKAKAFLVEKSCHYVGAWGVGRWIERKAESRKYGEPNEKLAGIKIDKYADLTDFDKAPVVKLTAKGEKKAKTQYQELDNYMCKIKTTCEKNKYECNRPDGIMKSLLGEARKVFPLSQDMFKKAEQIDGICNDARVLASIAVKNGSDVQAANNFCELYTFTRVKGTDLEGSRYLDTGGTLVPFSNNVSATIFNINQVSLESTGLSCSSYGPKTKQQADLLVSTHNSCSSGNLATQANSFSQIWGNEADANVSLDPQGAYFTNYFLRASEDDVSVVTSNATNSESTTSGTSIGDSGPPPYSPNSEFDPSGGTSITSTQNNESAPNSESASNTWPISSGENNFNEVNVSVTSSMKTDPVTNRNINLNSVSVVPVDTSDTYQTQSNLETVSVNNFEQEEREDSAVNVTSNAPVRREDEQFRIPSEYDRIRNERQLLEQEKLLAEQRKLMEQLKVNDFGQKEIKRSINEIASLDNSSSRDVLSSVMKEASDVKDPLMVALPVSARENFSTAPMDKTETKESGGLENKQINETAIIDQISSITGVSKGKSLNEIINAIKGSLGKEDGNSSKSGEGVMGELKRAIASVMNKDGKTLFQFPAHYYNPITGKLIKFIPMNLIKADGFVETIVSLDLVGQDIGVVEYIAPKKAGQLAKLHFSFYGLKTISEETESQLKEKAMHATENSDLFEVERIANFYKLRLEERIDFDTSKISLKDIMYSSDDIAQMVAGDFFQKVI